MKRKAIFLQYILKQEKTSMVYQVFEATHKNPIKNDFVKTCERYLNVLDIKLSFQEIENMSEWSFKKLVKTKTKEAGFKYLLVSPTFPKPKTSLHHTYIQPLVEEKNWYRTGRET